MSNSSLNQTAKFLLEADMKKAQGDAKEMITLMAGVEKLFESASKTAKKAAEDFQLKGSAESARALQVAIGNLGKSMRDVATSGGNAKVFSENEITKVLAIRTEMEKLEKALQTIQKNKAINEGTLGLDTGNIPSKLKALKDLEKAQRAVDAALKTPPESGKYTQTYLKDLHDRKAAIEENIRMLKLQTQALKDADLSKKQMGLNEDGQRQYDYRRKLAEEKTHLLQLTEERRAYLKNKSLMEQQQAKEFLTFNPNQALKQAFGSTNALGADSFQKINPAGTVTPEQIAAQRNVLALQEQLVERMRQKLPIDQAHKQLVEDILRAKQKENDLHRQTVHDLREQENAQRRISLASGVGAASLLAIQTAIRANGMILNGVQNAMGQALRSAISVETEFKNVQAVTATTNTEMQGLETTIKSVAASTKFSATEVAQAALILGQAGLSAKEAQAAIPAVAMLATAAGTRLAQAVSLTTSVLGVFDKQATETVDIANKITSAANTSKVSVEKLALGFQYAGNIAHLSGVSFEETTAAMAAMSNAGILNGSTLGSGLRSFLTEVQKPSQEFIATLNRIGLGLNDVDFKAHGLIGVTNRLREAGFVATDAIKSFDIRGAAAFNALVANPADLERQYKNLLDTNAAIQANEIQMDSLGAQSKRLQTSLENLAGAGFAPIGAVLKDLAGGFATILQKASECTITMGVLGTAVAVTSAVLTTRFAISMAAGAASLLSFNAATVASITALGSFTIAQAASTAMSAIRTAALAYMIGGFSGLTASITSATVSLTGFGAALGSVSLLTGVGIAVAAIAAAYYGISYASGSAKRAIDEATAASNNARAAFDEKTKTINGLDEALKSLIYKQNSLKTGSVELRTAVEEVNSKFGDQIKFLDVNNTSADTLIGTLRNLRKEMKEIATLNLGVAIAEAEKLKKATAFDAKVEFNIAAGLSGPGRPSSANSLDTLANTNSEQLKRFNIDPQQFKVVAESFRTGNRTPEVDRAIAAISQSLPIALSKSEIKLDYLSRNTLERLNERLPELGAAIVKERSSGNNIKSLESIQTRQNAVDALKAKPGLSAGSTLGDELVGPGALLEMIKEQNPGADTVQIFEKVRDEVSKRKAKNEELRKKLNEYATNDNPGKSDLLTEIANLDSALNSQRAQAQAGAEGLAKLRNEEAIDFYREKLKNLKRQPKTAKRDAEITALDKEESERVFNFENRAETNETLLKVSRLQAKRTNELKTENDIYKKDRGSRDPSDNIEQRTAKLDERLELLRAKSDKEIAQVFDDFETVTKYFESGKTHILNANAAAQRALKAEQNQKRTEAKAAGKDIGPGSLIQKEFDEQTQSLAAAGQENLLQYIAAFKGFGASASKQTKALTHSIQEKQDQLNNLKQDGELDLFDAGATLRNIQQKQIARDYSGSRPDAGLEVQANQEKLKLAEMAIKNNENILSLLGDGSTGLIGDQTQLLFNVNQQIPRLIKEVADAREKLRNLNPGSPEYTQEQSNLTSSSAELKVAQDESKKLTAELKALRGQKQTAQATSASLQGTKAEITAKIPVEFTFEKLSETLSNAVEGWKDAAGNLDVVSTIAKGMEGVFTTATNSIASGLKSIVDNTKSVKEGFKSMALGIVNAMLDISTQVVAMQSMKYLFGDLMGGGGGAGGGGGGFGAGAAAGGSSLLGSFFDSSAGSSEWISSLFSLGVASGGLIKKNGIERVQHFAGGGSVRGGKAGRDSVPAMLMPGEFVVNTKAVDAVGTDFLHGINAQANNVAASNNSATRASSDPQQSGVVNVWVVSPDQKPQMGPRDIEASIADNINRNGSIKQLIKSVQMGAL